MNLSALLSQLLAAGANLGLKLLGAAVLLVVGIYIIRLVKKFLRTSHRLDKMDEGLRSFLLSLTSILLTVLLAITVISVLGVPTTSFITMLASCGVAVGLALQGSLSNFAGGIMILIFKPFRVGDFIEAGADCGTVKEITVVYTVLLTPDNKRVTVPNGSLTNSVVKNYSSEELRRVDLTFTAAYDCDVEKVKSVLSAVIEAEPLALKDPEPTVRLLNHGDSALEYAARAWCKSEDYWTVFFNLNEAAKRAFDEADISIPFPQIDVHVDK